MSRWSVAPARECLLRLLPLLLVAVQAPAQAADASEWLKKGRDAIERRAPNKQKQDSTANPAVDQASSWIALGTMGVCGKKFAQDKEKQLLCAAGGIAAASVTKLIGNKISAGLKERDQREILTAASDSLRTGEPTTVKLPESGATVDITPAGNEQQKSLRVPIQIDTAVVNAELPTLHVIGGKYRASQKSSLSSSAADKARSVGSIDKHEDLHVLGKAGDSDKLLVAHWVMGEEDTYPRPMAIGYASAERLVAGIAPKEGEEAAQVDVKAAPQTLKLVEADVIVTCRDVAMKRKDPDGKIIEDTAFQCPGPDGIPIGG